MIFVCTGSQVFQFDRLIKKIDELVEQGIITDIVFAQIGATEYIPKFIKYKKFLSSEEFLNYQDTADIIISHGGTGALIGASKKGKNIIAVPRLEKYGEHIDNHQLQIVKVLENEGYVRTVYDIEKLGKVIQEAKLNPIQKVYQRESMIIEIVQNFIEHI